MSDTESTHDGARRRRIPLIAGVVAFAVIAGGGATLIATAGGGGDDGDGGSAAAKSVARDDAPPPRLSVEWKKAGERGIAPGEPAPSGGAVYVAGGELPDAPERAAVYRAAGEVTAARVARLGKALGLPGAPEADGAYWRIGGGGDGSDPVLRVSRQAPGAWTFSAYGGPRTGDHCLKGTTCPPGEVLPFFPPPGAASDAVSAADAAQAAAPVLRDLGLAGAARDTGTVRGSNRTVRVDLTVDDLPVAGWNTSIEVAKGGRIALGRGTLAPFAKGHAYPVLSAREVIDRKNEAVRISGTAPVPACASAVPLAGEVKPAPCGPGEGAGKPAPPARMVITEAVFGLAPMTVEGAQALVPSWLFRVDPDNSPTAFDLPEIAVDPAHLEQAPPPEKLRPSVPPTEPAAPSGGPRVRAYSTDGRTVTLTFEGGGCSDYRATATESGDEVSVRVIEPAPDPDTVCAAVALTLREKVTLGKPLGDRGVVDAGTGEAVPLSRS